MNEWIHACTAIHSFQEMEFHISEKNDFIQQTIFIQNIYCHFFHIIHSSILTLHLSFQIQYLLEDKK